MNPPPSPALAAIYGRVSTDQQTESLDAQDAKCLDYARLKGFDVPRDLMFADEDVSGKVPIHERRAGQRLFQALVNGYALPGQLAVQHPVKHLIVAKLDRLGRNAESMLAVWRWSQDQAVVIHIVDLGGETITSQGYAGKLIFGVLSLFAEFERELIRDRVQQSLDRKVKAGELIGTVPYGSDAVATGRATAKGKPIRALVDNHDEQRWLRQMVDWRGRGWGYERISKELNRLGIPTKRPAGLPVKHQGRIIGVTSGQWQAGNVAGVLQSKHTARLVGHSPPD